MSRETTGLWKPNPKFVISVLVGEVASAKFDQKSIKGRFGRVNRQLLPKLIEAFVNWPDDPESILRFTKRYGPAVLPPVERWIPKAGQSWRFGINAWRKFQREIRHRWDAEAMTVHSKPDLYRRDFSTTKAKRVVHIIAETGTEGFGPAHISTFHLNRGDEMEFSKSGDDHVLLQVSNLSRFLQISLDALPAERMKICRRGVENGCDTPYFIAEHLRQEYCSDTCAHWGQKAAKKEWWKRRKEAIEKAQKKEGGTKK